MTYVAFELHGCPPCGGEVHIVKRGRLRRTSGRTLWRTV